MKYQKPQKPVDERDKLRQFRELDDAFAKALRELDNPNNTLNIPTGPPVRSLESLEEGDKRTAEQHHSFEEQQEEAFRLRLSALLETAPLSRNELLDVIHTLIEVGHWPLTHPPVAATDPLVVETL